MKNKLTIKDICKKYKTRDGYIDVLENLNFTLSKGESLSIVGESGAGKKYIVEHIGTFVKTGQRRNNFWRYKYLGT